MTNILIVAPYPEKSAPSQRFRFEQYLGQLRSAGASVEVQSFWSPRHWPAIYQSGQLPQKVWATFSGFLRRFLLLFRLRQFDLVFIHREATPLGGPWWEWAAAKFWKKKLVYDFDDAIWLPNNSDTNAKLVAGLKNHSKTGKIIGLSSHVFAGNAFLADYARQFIAEVRVVPTTIDTDLHHNIVKNHKAFSLPVIGWTGTHSTLKQLMPLMPLLERVHQVSPFVFLLIADKAPEGLPDFVEFYPWSKSSEITDLLKLDIGIMPLFNTDWERGKCGFKALQYMALGIPAVVSSVGVNTEIVRDGLDGFLCEPLPLASAKNWERALLTLLGDQDLRAKLGTAGRERVVRSFSVKALENEYIALLDLAQRT